jgi:hypothetical protein
MNRAHPNWPPPEAKVISRGLGWRVYALTDPRDGLVHYIGFCREFSKRPWNHWADCLRPHASGAKRLEWLRDLRASGAGPYTVKVLERSGSREAAAEMETKWIIHGREAGWPLANMRDRGGLGTPPGFRRFVYPETSSPREWARARIEHAKSIAYGAGVR